MASQRKGYKRLIDEDNATASSNVSCFTLTNRTLLLLLLVSSLGHCLWPLIWALNQQHRTTHTASCEPESSLYAGLKYDVPTPFRDVSTFVHHNRVVADATWDSWVVEPGLVALTHEFVNGKMLPQTQGSPLDKEKGVYLLSSYHSLHCLVSHLVIYVRFFFPA
jgi:hypothetical protein